MRKKIFCGILALAGLILVLSPALANKNFVPDWTFKGSVLGQWKTLGAATWRAENGEIVGTPKSPEGGWLIMDKPLQDTQFGATFRCTGGCKAGVMLRTQTTAQGIQGAIVALPDGQNPGAAFAVKLDPQGREVSREALPRANGTVRVLADATAGGRGGAGAGQAQRRRGAPAQADRRLRRSAAGAARGRSGRTCGAAAAGRGGGRAGGAVLAAARPRIPRTRVPDYSYKPNEWNTFEAILDTNYLHSWVNDGPETGVTGRADDTVATLWPRGSVRRRLRRSAFQTGGTQGHRQAHTAGRKGIKPLPHAEAQRFLVRMDRRGGRFNHDGIMDLAVGPFST